jgi:hypothetical protein
MGKATILESLGEGEYRIKVEFDNTRVQGAITAMSDLISQLSAQLPDLIAVRDAWASVFQAHYEVLNNYLQTTPPEYYALHPETLKELTAQAYKAKATYDITRREVDRMRLKITGIEREKNYLETHCPNDFEARAWCVEFNEDLTGTTGTIECDYALMRDGDTIKNDTGIWLPAAIAAPGTQMQHPLASSPHATWINLCMAPAMQQHKGRYRIATITGLDEINNKCNLSFEGVGDVGGSSDKLLPDKPIFPNVNGAQSQNVTGADVVYGACGASAFEIGDRVIVDLHDGAGTPTVIGFYSHPKQCTWFKLHADADFPFYERTVSLTRFNLAIDIVSATHPMRLDPSLFAVKFDADAPVAATVLSDRVIWDSTHGNLVLFDDNIGFYSAKNQAPADNLTVTIEIYKDAVPVSSAAFTAANQAPTLSPVHVTVSQPTGKLWGVTKNGNEGYFIFE